MITNIGKNLIGKYLVGQTTQYASHIALGCGVKPIDLTTPYSDYSSKENMNFEMTRVPIISRGYLSDRSIAALTNISVTNGIGESVTFTVSSSVTNSFIVNQNITISGVTGASVGGISIGLLNTSYTITNISSNGLSITAMPLGWGSSAPTSTASVAKTGTITGYINKISLIAELPIDDRYEFTELALWSDTSNPIPSGVDSKNIFNFGRNSESWKYVSSSTNTSSSISYITTALDNGNISNNFDTPPMISPKAVLTNSDNSFFNTTRINRFERPRFLDDCLILGADLSKFEISGGTTVLNSLDTTYNSDYITLANISMGNFDTNSQTDELILAYSLISKLASGTTLGTIESVNVMIEFQTNVNNVSAKYHFKQTSPYLDSTNRYQTISLPLSSGVKPTAFLWKDVVSVNIYASIQDSSGNSMTNYVIALDGLNLNNKNNLNSSNYGMVAYVPIRNNPTISSISGTLGTVSGTGPYTATITGLQTSNYLVGSKITAQDGTGSLGTGVVTVSSIASSTSINVSSTATMTAGTLSSITGQSPASSILKNSNNTSLVEFRLVLGNFGV